MEKAAAIASVAKDILSDWKRLEKLNATETNDESSKARRDKARNDGSYICMDIEKRSHELHCLAVEAGIAKPEPYRYGTVFMEPDAWHKYKVVMRCPENYQPTPEATP